MSSLTFAPGWRLMQRNCRSIFRFGVGMVLKVGLLLRPSLTWKYFSDGRLLTMLAHSAFLSTERKNSESDRFMVDKVLCRQCRGKAARYSNS